MVSLWFGSVAELTRILLECSAKTSYRCFEMFLVENIGDARFLKACAWRCIESVGWCHHDGLAFKFKFLEQPLAKMLRIGYRKLCNAVKCATWLWAEYARNTIEAIYHDVSARNIFGNDLLKIAFWGV